MTNNNNNFFGPEKRPIDEGALAGRYRQSWTEESLYFEKSFGRQPAMSKSNEHVGTSFAEKKARYFFVFLTLIFMVIGGRIFYLQIIKGRQYQQTAESNRQRIISIPAERGLIFDRHNIPFTKNIPSFSLAVIPQDLPRADEERKKIIEKLSALVQKPKEEIATVLNEYGSYSYESIVIQENLDYDTALAILIVAADLPGIQITRGSKRLYLNDVANESAFNTSTQSSFSHVIGYLGKLSKEDLSLFYPQGYLPADNIGKIGLEKEYEQVLRGVYGRKRIEVNAIGREQSVLAEEAPIPGKHLRLAIDAKMQAQLEKVIADNLKAAGKKRASGIILNPQNGEVLALVSYPAYDNNDFSGGISTDKYQAYLNNEDQPLFNRAISGIFPSGSCIKPAMASAALQEGIINETTSFLSTGGLQVGQWFFPDWQAGGHGVTNVRKSLAWSINTFYYYIGGGYGDFVGLGVEKIVSYLKKFGFSEKSNIDLPSEGVGFLPSKEWKQQTKGERWYIGDTYNLSIGQGDLLVTPLQIASMTATVANGGALYEPHVVKAIVDPVTKQEQIVNPKIIKQNFISANNLRIVRLGMRDCVIYGSCRRLSQLYFSVAGKTGTAQWNTTKDNHAWFTSFAPFDNPEIVMTILVEEGGEGSGIGGLITYDFYKWWGEYRRKLNKY